MKRVRYDKQETAMFSLNVVHEYFIVEWHDKEMKKEKGKKESLDPRQLNNYMEI